jgi:hypothetical protein
MRHFFAAPPVAALSCGMLPPPRPTVLVALSGALKRPPPGLPRALSGTVNLAAVAAATDHHLHAAACAEEQPRRRRLGGVTWLNIRWTYPTIAGMLALHACPGTVWGTASSLTAKLRSRRRAYPSREASLTRQRRPGQRAQRPGRLQGRRHHHRGDGRLCTRRPPTRAHEGQSRRAVAGAFSRRKK